MCTYPQQEKPVYLLNYIIMYPYPQQEKPVYLLNLSEAAGGDKTRIDIMKLIGKLAI